ncbi:BsaA family SipW-dependent biofilm matrix protein [Clostridium sardiniense]|uniref:BsaA family SipW-dependent biofilm matrix protein n=1 Tax=Clostridium sardiniense TaxID=29369 RepID=A0ABS7KT40_CLOSR|nr:BsaA family SipW-dependent biofilm matrix protein [Clostridium sardiniense]MBY0753920.1 BsaA family SipW-dependent biofilm matrix protein [Clostridium sardiniense]MDQ0459565.1 putative ribosomally synthesized peptide with SipW-like signal peptide [Clostridium sardiniense]
MGKKKIIGLCLAVGLMVGVVGGSLAWFTDNAEVPNSFATQGNGIDETNGIKIEEVFDKELASKVLPGTDVNKDAKVKNTASYDQIIRVKFEKEWTTNTDGKNLNLDFIELKYQNLTETPETNKWIDGKDGYFYYNGVVAAGTATEYLLDSVTLSTKADNDYKNVGYDVIVKAEGIQASNGAVSSAWTTAPDVIKNLGN